MKFILGRKLQMTQIFDKEGNLIPVTLVQAGPCKIVQIKTKEKDGYEAIQVGFLPKKKNVKKTEKGKEFYFLREFRVQDPNQYKVGQEIDVSQFEEGEKIKVSAISKGKGFAGVVKRWGFAGRPKTHGTKHEERAPGAIGSATPHRVVKGRKMAGKTGQKRVTIKNLVVVKVDKENNILAIKGAIPGSRGTLVEIKKE
jgi:large subunit ribosomal protein L3